MFSLAPFLVFSPLAMFTVRVTLFALSATNVLATDLSANEPIGVDQGLCSNGSCDDVSDGQEITDISSLMQTNVTVQSILAGDPRRSGSGRSATSRQSLAALETADILPPSISPIVEDAKQFSAVAVDKAFLGLIHRASSTSTRPSLPASCVRPPPNDKDLAMLQSGDDRKRSLCQDRAVTGAPCYDLSSQLGLQSFAATTCYAAIKLACKLSLTLDADAEAGCVVAGACTFGRLGLLSCHICQSWLETCPSITTDDQRRFVRAIKRHDLLTGRVDVKTAPIDRVRAEDSKNEQESSAVQIQIHQRRDVEPPCGCLTCAIAATKDECELLPETPGACVWTTETPKCQPRANSSASASLAKKDDVSFDKALNGKNCA